MNKVSFSLLVLFILCIGLSACATGIDDQDTVESAAKPPAYDTTKLNLLEPENDADAAIANNQYTLLAFANKLVSVPGVDMQKYPLELLESQCGIRVLSGTGDTVKIGESLEHRKALRQYAQRYNQLVFHACQIFQKNYGAAQQ